MSTLLLADLAGLSDAELREHIADEYGNTSLLAEFDVLVAYESVGSCGCDSASYFLLRKRETGELFENHAGHCSCYGFEGQFEPEAVTLEYLRTHPHIGTGGYDDHGNANLDAIYAYFDSLTDEAKS